LNYGLVDAKYRSSFTTASGENVVSGDKIPGIARQTLKVRAVYTFSPDLMAGANLVVASSQYAHGNESNSDPTGVVSGYTVLNVDLHYKVSGELLFSANMNNLFNKQYATYGLSGTQSVYSLATEQFLTPAAPRAIWVGLTYRFGGIQNGWGQD
jgi:outer membrane receptor protein involved in Fe transport